MAAKDGVNFGSPYANVIREKSKRGEIAMQAVHKLIYSCCVSIPMLWLWPPAASAQDDLVFFGTHSAGPQKGISVAHFNPETGALTQPELVVEAPAPAYFILHPDGKSGHLTPRGTPVHIAYPFCVRFLSPHEP